MGAGDRRRGLEVDRSRTPSCRAGGRDKRSRKLYNVPDEEELVEIARNIGINLPADEVKLYRKYLAAQLEVLDGFVQSRVEEDQPPMVSPSREPGYRPGQQEDPLDAWTWKCRIEGAPGGPLAGKTVSYKDHVSVAGIPMSLGSFAMEGFLPDFDATIVTRVLQAGGTIVGKNTMNGLSGGFGLGGGIGDYGRPLNPHDPDHVTGASSAGSGAAVAAGEVDISFGGDQGGSIRIPAAMSGTIGLKPTFGLISHFGIGFGSDQSIDYTGPMSLTVEDSAAALEATAGYDGYDPRQGRDIPERLDVLGGLDAGVSGLKIGILEEGLVGAESGVLDGVMAAVDVLEEAGAKVSKVSIPEHELVTLAQTALAPEGSLAVFRTGFFGAFTRTYYPASLIAAINKLWFHQADLLNPRTKLGYLTAEVSRRTYYGRVYAKAQNARPALIRAYDRALGDLDALVMPTALTTAPLYEKPETWEEAIEEALSFSTRIIARNTQPFDFTGHPALAVPVGKSAGLPVSMQLVGRRLDDALLFRIAYAYEHSVSWTEVVGLNP